MKHRHIALSDEKVLVIVIAPHDGLCEKTVSTIQKVMARGGKVLLISDKAGLAASSAEVWHTVEAPTATPFIAPLR